MIGQLTAVRGLMAWWVVLYHFVGSHFAPQSFGPLQLVIDRGYLAVDGFFILSGLIIAHVYGPRLDEGEATPTEFLRARIARVYPAHLVALLAFVPLVAGVAAVGRDLPGEYPVEGFVASLLLVHAWGPIQELTWNYPSWAVSSELFAYLLAPAVFLRLRHAGGHVHAVVVAIVGAVLVYAEVQDPPALVTWTFHLSLLRVTAGFCLGVVIAARTDAGGRRDRAGALAAVALLTAGLGLRSDLVTVIGLALALRTLYAWPRIDLPDVLLGAGARSYAVYLVHALVQVSLLEATRDVDPGGTARWVLLGVALVATEVLARGLFRWVEEPARQWLNALRLPGVLRR